WALGSRSTCSRSSEIARGRSPLSRQSRASRTTCSGVCGTVDGTPQAGVGTKTGSGGGVERVTKTPEGGVSSDGTKGCAAAGVAARGGGAGDAGATLGAATGAGAGLGRSGAGVATAGGEGGAGRTGSGDAGGGTAERGRTTFSGATGGRASAASGSSSRSAP